MQRQPVPYSLSVNSLPFGVEYRSRYRHQLRTSLSEFPLPVGAIFFKISRVSLGLTQPPIQWVPSFFLGGEVVGT